MSFIAPQGEQNTSTEIAALAQLAALSVTPAGFYLVKTGLGTFGVSPAPVGTITAAQSTFLSAVSGNAWTNGQLMIGNTASPTGVSFATLTAGSNIQISNSNGSITIASTGGSGTVTSVSVTTANGFGGTVATATSTPAITITTGVTGLLLGNGTGVVASKVTLTQPATGSTITVLDNKTLTANNNITLAGTDGKSLTLTTGLTVTTNDGTLAFGAASKTLTVNNSLTLAGTDSTTMTFPSSSATVAGLGISQTFTGVNTLTPAARTSGALPYFIINAPADTGQTASTESIGIQTATATRTWATTGTVALQREIYHAGVTYASAGASQTFTDITTMYIDRPIAGTNAIFTRAHSLTIVDSTTAASSITGGFVISTTLGTTATSVGIGAGNINAGGTLTVGGHVTLEGVTSTGATGTNLLVFATSPTISTPTINQINASASTVMEFNAGTYTPIQTYSPGAGATATLDLSKGNIHHITMPAGNITIALSNGTAGQCFVIRILQDGGGSRTVTWFTTIRWVGGSAPTLTTTGAKVDTFGFEITGASTYDGFVVGQNI